MENLELKQLIDTIFELSDKLYQSNCSNQVSNIIDIIEKITVKLTDNQISNDNLNYFNIITENILKSIEIKDWIFIGDIMRYELINFVKEVFVCL